MSTDTQHLLDQIKFSWEPLAVDCSGGLVREWLAMAGYDEATVIAVTSALTGAGITAMLLQAAEDGSGTNATTIKTLSAADIILAAAVGGKGVLSATAAEIAKAGEALGYRFTHVGLKLTCANAADVVGSITILSEGRKYADQTASS